MTSWLYVFAGLTPWVQVALAALLTVQVMGLVFLLREIMVGSRQVSMYVYIVEKERPPAV